MKKIILLALVFLLAACSSSTPSTSEVEKLYLERKYANGGGEIIKIDHFERKNGYPGKDGEYIVEAKFDITFNRSLEEIAEILKSKTDGSWISIQMLKHNIDSMREEFGDFKAGFTGKREGKITLIKTEQGWRISD